MTGTSLVLSPQRLLGTRTLSRRSGRRHWPRRNGGKSFIIQFIIIDALRFIIQDVFKLTEAKAYSVSEIVSSEVRIILLYSTQEEAKLILANAAKAGLNTSNYLWIVTQSVVGDPSDKMMGLGESFPIGMLGIHFTPNLDTILKDIMPKAVKVSKVWVMMVMILYVLPRYLLRVLTTS